MCSISLHPALRRHLEIWSWPAQDTCNSKLLFCPSNILLGQILESPDALSFLPQPPCLLSPVSCLFHPCTSLVELSRYPGPSTAPCFLDILCFVVYWLIVDRALLWLGNVWIVEADSCHGPRVRILGHAPSMALIYLYVMHCRAPLPPPSFL